jgi:hypothetical protein
MNFEDVVSNGMLAVVMSRSGSRSAEVWMWMGEGDDVILT